MLRTLTIIGCLLAVPVEAAEWKSADSKLSVEIPDESKFVIGEADPPIAAIWISNDETIKLSVVEVPMPPGVKLIQSSAEEGLAEEMGGEIIESSSRQLNGHDVYFMTCHGTIQDTELYFSQSIAAIEGKVYKLMAIGMGRDIRGDADVHRFFDSLQIHVAHRPSPARSRTAEREEEDDQTSVDNWSGKIGAISLLFLLGFGVSKLLSKSRR
ncbi:hypothetical protein [Aeoliella mucimassa]|uniref:Uncharacterized protein n=1 Tax=Aeoliella mucimassa TaxID=2527972 RepID=A0A518AV47_9BACT|nr:hypothetical protein [Aeoliella mucimassa]QDU58605.1 hypothetical protein Pan181_48440 [Aeoliella mucimassa]